MLFLVLVQCRRVFLPMLVLPHVLFNCNHPSYSMSQLLGKYVPLFHIMFQCSSFSSVSSSHVPRDVGSFPGSHTRRHKWPPVLLRGAYQPKVTLVTTLTLYILSSSNRRWVEREVYSSFTRKCVCVCVRVCVSVCVVSYCVWVPWSP